MYKRTFTYGQTYQWTSSVLRSFHKVFYDLNFDQILPAVLSSELEPGAFHSFAVMGDRIRPIVEKIESDSIERQVQVTGKETYYLPVSHNFEKQQSLEFLERVYCIAPCIRLLQEGENVSKKHLNSFFQVEVEWKTESMADIFNTAETLLKGVASELKSDINSNKIENATSMKNIDSILLGEFPKVTFSEALKLIGEDPNRTIDFTTKEDIKLSEYFDRPFWIYDYPKAVRDAVYHENASGNFDTYDLMLPFGYGELSTGGIRPKTGESILLQSLTNLSEDPKTLTYGHANWKNNKKIQTAGLGIGFERFMRFVSESSTVFDFIQAHDHGPNKNIKINGVSIF